MTHTRYDRFALLFGRVAGLLLAGAGAFAGWALYSEFRVWTDPIFKQISLLILCGGAVAFALIQGGRMFFVKTTRELSFTPSIRVFAVAIIIAMLLLGFLFTLPARMARGPLPVIALGIQLAVVIAGLLPLMRGSDRRRQDGA